MRKEEEKKKQLNGVKNSGGTVQLVHQNTLTHLVSDYLGTTANVLN